MNLSTSHRFAALALVAVLSLSMGACSSDDDAGSPTGGAKNKTEAGGSAGEAGGAPNMTVEDNGRAFGATNDMVVETLNKVMDVDDVAWSGSQVQLTFTEGSIEDAGAWTPCISAGAILSDGETVVLRYPDGELDCEKRYDY